MSTSAVEAISIKDFMNENWEKFAALETSAEEGLTNISRTMPPEFHISIQKSIFRLLASSAFNENLEIRVIIDSNIIIQDAFRVAQGKDSTTDRILSSPYLKVMAPPDIIDEVESQIRKKLPKGASEEIALRHARSLLSRINIMSNIGYANINKARSQIGEKAPEDIPFLALAFESEAKVIISRDKRAFDQQSVFERWEMGRTVEVVISYESGCLSFVILGASIELLLEALDNLIIMLIDAFEKVVEVIFEIITGIITGSLEALSEIPPWVWAAGAVALIAALFHDGFRAWIGEGLKKIGDALGSIAQAIIEAIKTLWEALKAIFIWIWNLLVPLIAMSLVIAGVLCRRIFQFINEYQKLQKEVN